MKVYEFAMGEPDLSEIACDSIRSILLETIAQHLGTKNCRIKLDAASKQGDNFIGIVQRVTYNTVEEDTYRMLILKTAPTNPARRQRFFSRPCFLREIYLYNEVKFVEFFTFKCNLIIGGFRLGFTLFSAISTNQRRNCR